MPQVHHPKTVLVLDSPDTRELIRLILEAELEVSVVAAENERHLLSLAVEISPALVLVAASPEEHDLAVVRRLKAESSLSRVPVVALVFAGDDRGEVLAAGADDWLNKPFEIDLLLSKVKRYVSS